MAAQCARISCGATHKEARLSLDTKSFMRQIAVSLHDKRMIVFVLSLVTKIVLFVWKMLIDGNCYLTVVEYLSVHLKQQIMEAPFSK